MLRCHSDEKLLLGLCEYDWMISHLLKFGRYHFKGCNLALSIHHQLRSFPVFIVFGEFKSIWLVNHLNRGDELMFS